MMVLASGGKGLMVHYSCCHGGVGGTGRCSPVLGVRGWALFCSKQGLSGGRQCDYMRTASQGWVDNAIDGVLALVTVVGATTDLLGFNRRRKDFIYF